MTPAQQSALESVAGRSLSPAELAQLEPLLDHNNRNDVAIAALLTGTEPCVVSYWLTDRGLVADLVNATGSLAMSDSILTKLDGLAAASRSTKAMMNRLENDARGVDFGDPALRSQFSALGAANVLTAAEVSAVLALAQRPAKAIDFNVVSNALNIAEGRMTLNG